MRLLIVLVGGGRGASGSHVLVDVAPVLVVAAAGTAYAIGVARMASRPSGRRTAAFLAALLALLVALAPPLAGAASELFAAHMVQHLLLLLVAAPLLVLARPGLPLLLFLPRAGRRAVTGLGRVVRPLEPKLLSPLTAAVVFVAVVWAWHLPSAYSAAVEWELLHAVEHASLVGVAVWLWWSLREVSGTGREPVAVVALLVVALATGLLGALLAFSGVPVYAAYAGTTHEWGVTALQDQRAAGVIMWVPSGMVYALVAAGLFLRWISRLERREWSATSEGTGRAR